MIRRNNGERFGAPQPDSDPIIADDEQADSLSFVVPTEFVVLPTKGAYYPPDHTLHMQESIEIKFMTAKEEDLLTSKTLIEKGIVLDRLIDNLIVDKKVKSRDLLVADRNAILIAARSSGYGTDYRTNITCRQCSHTDAYNYDLQEAQTKPPCPAEQLAASSITQVGPNLFETTIHMAL